MKMHLSGGMELIGVQYDGCDMMMIEERKRAGNCIAVPLTAKTGCPYLSGSPSLPCFDAARVLLLSGPLECGAALLCPKTCR